MVGAVIETEQNVSVYVVLADNDDVSSVVLPHFETNNKPFWFTENYINFTILPPRWADFCAHVIVMK